MVAIVGLITQMVGCKLIREEIYTKRQKGEVKNKKKILNSFNFNV